jgi:GT2 family glycosyltransferase
VTLPPIGVQSSAGTTSSSHSAGVRPLVSVVVITRDRRTEVLETLRKLIELPETPPIIVVDNGSRDGTAEAVSSAHPMVDVVRLASNAGAAARNIGVSLAKTPFVAFADDDSGWEPGALSRAADIFGRHPEIALVAARVLNGPGREIDAACRVMAEGLPRRDALPGPPVLGFIACGAIVERERFLAAGGFPSRYGVGGEEAPLALALASAGWALIYALGHGRSWCRRR